MIAVLAFYDADVLVNGDVGENLHSTGRPAHDQAVHQGVVSQTEVDYRLGLSIAIAGAQIAALTADTGTAVTRAPKGVRLLAVPTSSTRR